MLAAEGEVLEGELERLVYEAPGRDFTVAVLRLACTGAEVRIVGDLSGLRVGEHLRCTGKWVDHPRFGRQFRVEHFAPILPSSTKGIERYLATAGIQGIGPGMAKRLVEKFGTKTFEVLEREPHRLAEVSGIGPSRARALGEAFAARRASREVLAFLHTHGLGPALARKIHRAYGDAAALRVRENPYRLAQEIPGVGFRTADALARSLGYDLNSPERAAAAALYVLESAGEEGHLYLPATELKVRCDKLEVAANVVEEALVLLRERGAIHLEGKGPHLAVFLEKFYQAEVKTARRLERLLHTPGPALGSEVHSAIAQFERQSGLRLSEGQRLAVARALESKIFVLTGGPGTGKTTLVNAIISLLEHHGARVELAAPTGRAAKRLEEASGRSARTLHRLLEFNPRSGTFQRGPDNPLRCEAVVVDEASMVDLLLFVSLVEALPASARLYLVGDVDQLPSVGAGDVLRDVIASGMVPVARLTEVFRQAGGSAIVESAHRVNRGEMPAASEEDSDFFHVERDDGPSAARTILDLVQDRIPRRFGFDPIRDVQVLAPMHRGAAGVENLNRLLQEALNPPPAPPRLDLVPEGEGLDPEPRRPTEVFRMGDKVIQIRNNYLKEVFNGDIGRILLYDPEGPSLTVDFDGRAVSYEGDELEELQLAYALSVHKSQGSEYPVVVLSLLKEHYPMLQRNLLYTALTRGKRLVVVVGSRRALELAVRNASQRERFTRLAERLRQAVIGEP
jgi:exodeoxyribonuclease V alpha subunit